MKRLRTDSIEHLYEHVCVHAFCPIRLFISSKVHFYSRFHHIFVFISFIFYQDYGLASDRLKRIRTKPRSCFFMGKWTLKLYTRETNKIPAFLRRKELIYTCQISDYLIFTIQFAAYYKCCVCTMSS